MVDAVRIVSVFMLFEPVSNVIHAMQKTVADFPCTTSKTQVKGSCQILLQCVPRATPTRLSLSLLSALCVRACVRV